MHEDDKKSPDEDESIDSTSIHNLFCCCCSENDEREKLSKSEGMGGKPASPAIPSLVKVPLRSTKPLSEVEGPISSSVASAAGGFRDMASP